MARREIEEFKQKLHPNAKLRAWYASHTFGGTTKVRSLKILGFSKVNFYYIAGALGALALIAAVTGGLGVRNSLQKAKVQGAAQGIPGQPAVQSTTQRRTRTLVSNGQTIVTTETSAFLTTFIRGAGTTQIRTKNEQGEDVTLPASLSIFTNSDGNIATSTFVGTGIFVTNDQGIGEQTFIYGEPQVITSNGQEITTTRYAGLSIGTDENGQTVTSYDAPEPTPGATATGDGGGPDITDAPGGTATGTNGVPPSATTTVAMSSSTRPTTAATSRPSSSSKASTSSASGGGGGGGGGSGEEFEGEATFYAPGLGSCGTEATDADFVAALSKVLFDATGATNSNNNPYCGRKALVRAASGGSRRRWQWEGNSNITGGPQNWDKTRNDRWSRRSAVSLETDERGPTPSRNESDSKPLNGDGPSMPGITPPPTIGPWKRQAGGGGVTITIVDRCPVCAQYDLDLSPAAYNILGDADAGRIPIRWSWLD